MKDPTKLQEKLASLLKGSKLKIGFSLSRPLNDLEFREIARVVEDYVVRNTDSPDSEPFGEWLEEYKFFIAESKQ